jgi:hypothetical protein
MRSQMSVSLSQEIRSKFDKLEPELPRGTVLLAAVLLAIDCNSEEANKMEEYQWLAMVQKAQDIRAKSRSKSMDAWRTASGS